MRIATGIAVVVLLGLPLAGCGGDAEERAERGLAVPNEVTTPESEKDMQESEAQRQKNLQDQEAAVQRKAFDAAESGKEQ